MMVCPKGSLGIGNCWFSIFHIFLIIVAMYSNSNGFIWSYWPLGEARTLHVHEAVFWSPRCQSIRTSILGCRTSTMEKVRGEMCVSDACMSNFFRAIGMVGR